MSSIRCETCDLTLSNHNYFSHLNGRKHKQKEDRLRMPDVDKFRCDICKVSIDSKDDYIGHINGRKHKQQEENLQNVKNLEETGLFLQGVPRGANASDLLAHFGRFGEVVKVDIHGYRAYLNFRDKIQADEALKQQHILHGHTMSVSRRQIFKDTAKQDLERKFVPMQQKIMEDSHEGERQPSTSEQHQQKRSFDGKFKSQPQPGIKDAMRGPILIHSEILTALSQAKSISVSEQVAMLKNLVLAGEELCNHIQQSIMYDLKSALRQDFKICELFTFGSMTTGLAFKDSDLDVYAHLEIKESTHWQHNMSSSGNFNKIFTIAKKCLYRKGHIFNSIVPLQKIRVPLIKFVHLNTLVSCDMSFQSLIGHCNSKLLRHYLLMNERFFELIFFLKFWASVHKFCTTSKFSNFALCMLGLSFLLSLRGLDGNKLLPSVYELLESGDPSDPHYVVENWRCGFNQSPVSVVLPETQEFSLPGLLKKFFVYISQIPFKTHVISVLTGDLIPRDTFEQSPDLLPDAYAFYKSHISLCPLEALCKPEDAAVLHDPFLLKHNLIKRVTLQTLQEFIEACVHSSGLCAEALESNEEQLLYQLLCPNLPTKESMSPKNSKVIVLIKEPQFSENSQFKCLEDVVRSIFEKILLLKVTSVSKVDLLDSAESSKKVLKVENMQDVNDDGFISLLSCEGLKDVWTGRKKTIQSLKFEGILKDPLTFESQQIASENMRYRAGYTVNIKFQCEIKKDKLGKILMKFSDMCHNYAFPSLCCFLQNCLSSWIFTFSREN